MMLGLGRSLGDYDIPPPLTPPPPSDIDVPPPQPPSWSPAPPLPPRSLKLKLIPPPPLLASSAATSPKKSSAPAAGVTLMKQQPDECDIPPPPPLLQDIPPPPLTPTVSHHARSSAPFITPSLLERTAVAADATSLRPQQQQSPTAGTHQRHAYATMRHQEDTSLSRKRTTSLPHPVFPLVATDTPLPQQQAGRLHMSALDHQLNSTVFDRAKSEIMLLLAADALPKWARKQGKGPKPPTIQQIVEDPELRLEFREYLKADMATENLDFLLEVERCGRLMGVAAGFLGPTEIKLECLRIYLKYIDESCEAPLNISSTTKDLIKDELFK